MKNYGTVETEDGIVVTLTQPAEPVNYLDYVRYESYGSDCYGNEYRVQWDTTADWDAHEDALSSDGRYHCSICDGSCQFLEDGANACDWDNPVLIELL